MFKESNPKIRKIIRENQIPQWKIAQKIGVKGPTVTRWLRVPLTKAHRIMIEKAMKSLVIDRAHYYAKVAKEIKVE